MPRIAPRKTRGEFDPDAIAAALNNKKSAVGLGIDEIEAFIKRVSSCFPIPLGAKSADELRTGVTIRLNRDGTLATEPQITSRPPGRYAQIAPETLVRALKNCAPFSFPVDKYDGDNGWNEISLDFYPSAMFTAGVNASSKPNLAEPKVTFSKSDCPYDPAKWMDRHNGANHRDGYPAMESDDQVRAALDGEWARWIPAGAYVALGRLDVVHPPFESRPTAITENQLDRYKALAESGLVTIRVISRTSDNRSGFNWNSLLANTIGGIDQTIEIGATEISKCALAANGKILLFVPGPLIFDKIVKNEERKNATDEMRLIYFTAHFEQDALFRLYLMATGTKATTQIKGRVVYKLDPFTNTWQLGGGDTAPIDGDFDTSYAAKALGG